MPALQELVSLSELQPVHIGSLVAAVVFTLVLLISKTLNIGDEVRRRAVSSLGTSGKSLDATWQVRAGRVMDQAAALFSQGDKAISSLRRELIQAGFFSPYAVAVFHIVRILTAIVLPALFLLAVPIVPYHVPVIVAAVSAISLTLTGLVLPPVLLDALIRSMQRRYRHALPDMMDLLVVCVESGQSIQSAFQQVGREMLQVCPPLGFNLHLLSLELRAGSTILAALHSLHGRLGLDEVKSLAVLLKQSEELGSSIAGTLRVFSDEMREKRLTRAETRANLLPVKMTIPLGMFIFPVLLLVILLPAVIRIKNAFV